MAAFSDALPFCSGKSLQNREDLLPFRRGKSTQDTEEFSECSDTLPVSRENVELFGIIFGFEISVSKAWLPHKAADEIVEVKVRCLGL